MWQEKEKVDEATQGHEAYTNKNKKKRKEKKMNRDRQ